MSQGVPESVPGEILRPRIEGLVRSFNERARTDDKLRQTLKDMERSIQIDIAGEGSYHFFLKDYQIDGVRDGPTADPNILIATDKVTMAAIIDGELSPTRAYMNKKFKIKATMLDLLVLRKLF